MRSQSSAVTDRPGGDTRTPFESDLGRMGLDLSTDGSTITLRPQVLPHLFGRPARCDFTLTMATTALLRLRHLLTPVDDCLHLPVTGHLSTDEVTAQPTTRLIATATSAPRLRLEVTTWNTSPDGRQAWLDTVLLDDLTAPDIEHFHAVRALWDAGIHPLHKAARYVAAGLSAAEALAVLQTTDPAEIDVQVEMLAALRRAT